MIDHVSLGVKDLALATSFYQALLEKIGISILIEKPGAVGFGKSYPEFWLNHRPDKELIADTGCHICLRANSVKVVDDFYATAVSLGADKEGAPGFRPEYHQGYYAAFIKDRDLNHIEVVTFVSDDEFASKV